MKRAARAATYLLAISAMLLALLGGCARTSVVSPRPVIKERADQFIDDEGARTPIRYPLAIISKKTSVDGCIISYPYVCDDNMNQLNNAILSVFSGAVEGLSSAAGVEYTTEFNRMGLLSFIMTCYSETGRTLFVDTVNFDCDSAKRIYLPDCFGSSSEYAAKLDEIVKRTVESGGYTLLADVPPTDASRLFVFTLGGLCLIYREYELCTYDAGIMRIRASLSAISGCIASDGLLNRLK